MRRVALLLLCLLAVAWLVAPAARADQPPIMHVFLVVLENKDHDESFGQTGESEWLARTLPRQGELLRQYYGIGHESLDNYLAMVSGQAPNPQTQADCLPTFSEVVPGVQGPDGQAIGVGFLYPSWVKTIGDQLEAAGKTWKGYMEDMGTPVATRPSARRTTPRAPAPTTSTRPATTPSSTSTRSSTIRRAATRTTRAVRRPGQRGDHAQLLLHHP